MVPKRTRRSIVRARVVLPGLALGGRGPIRRIGRRTRVDQAREEDRASVRAPQRARGAGGDIRHALGLAPTAQVQHVDLRRIVALAARAEGDPPAIRAPIDATLAAFGIREAEARRSRLWARARGR